jgi:hypothetical protein
MVTVLSVSEFEKLLINKELQHSSNIDFIKNQDLKVLIKKMLAEKTGKPNPFGFITVVLSDDTSSVSARILDKTNKFNQVLPRPTKPVYLHLRASTQGLSIDTDTLLDVEDFDLKDRQTQELLYSFFDDTDEGLRYFFVPTLNVLNIEEVFYDRSLEEEIRRIKSGSSDHDLLYQPLNLF